MAAAVGLQIDMAPWKKSLDEAAVIAKQKLAGIDPKANFSLGSAMKDSMKAIDEKSGGWGAKISGVFGKITGSIGGFGMALGGIGTAVAGAVAAGGAFYSFMANCAGEAKALNKSWGAVNGSVKLLSEEQQKLFKKDTVIEWAKRVSTAYGVSTQEVLQGSAQAIGKLAKTPEQMERLGVLAAAAMKKSGKSYAEVMKIITEAGSGQVEGMKELGVQIAATGDRAKDSKEAMKALATAFGSGDLPMISAAERLSLGLTELKQNIGQAVLPVFNALQESVGDFILGLTKTAEGSEVIKDLAQWFQTLVEFAFDFGAQIMDIGSKTGSVFKMIFSAAGTLATGLMQCMFDPILEKVQQLLEALESMSKAMGGSGELGSKTVKGIRDQMQVTKDYWADSTKNSWNNLTDIKEGGFVSEIKDLTKAGKAVRETEAKEMQKTLDDTKKDGLGESTRMDDGRAKIQGDKDKTKAAASAAKAQEKLQKEQAKSAKKRSSAVANLMGGMQNQQLSIKVLSTSPRRFDYV